MTSTGVASMMASWAGVGGRTPASRPSTAGVPSAWYMLASAWDSRTEALGRTVARLEWAS